jgi:hypothetical protein
VPFQPTDISGCKLWLAADALGLSDNDPVGSWPDASGQGNDGSVQAGAFRPLFKTNQVNSKPIVRFDFTNTYTMTFTNWMSGLSAATIFAVVKQTASSGVLFQNWDNDGDTEFYPFGDGNIYIGTGSTSRKSCGAPITPVTAFHIFGVITQAGGWELRLNDGVQFSTGSNTVGWNTSPEIGYNAAPSDVAEVIVYDSALGSTDRASVIAYLNVKYGFGGGGATYTASGTLTAAHATLSASATYSPGTHTASGTLTAAHATLAASAAFTAPVYHASGSLAAAHATLSASATFTAPVYHASGTLAAAHATLAGTAIFATAVYSGSGSLTAGHATASGSATFTPPTYHGTAALTAGHATASGSASFTAPVYHGSAVLTAGHATFSGSAHFAASISRGSGSLIVAAAVCAGTATFTISANDPYTDVAGTWSDPTVAGLWVDPTVQGSWEDA